MNADVETYNKYIRKQIADVHAAVKGLSEEQLNRRPDCARCEQRLRDRDARHRQPTGVGAGYRLRAAVAARPPGRVRVVGEVRGAREGGLRPFGRDRGRAAALDPSTVEDRFVPSKELRGEGEPHEISRREALAHVLEHASMHLGQIQLTADLVGGF